MKVIDRMFGRDDLCATSLTDMKKTILFENEP